LACERCADATASDVVIFRARLRDPSGGILALKVVVTADVETGFQRPPMFCDRCWLHFLQMFGEIGTAVRLIGEKAPAS